MKNEIKITFVKSPEEGEICAVFVNEFWDRSKTKLSWNTCLLRTR